MRVQVRLFAIQRDLAGVREVGLELPEGATIETVWAAVVERHPMLAPGRRSVRFARNGAYAAPEIGVADGDEIAFIPPVSGGSEPPRAPEARRIIELRAVPLEPSILADLAECLGTTEDGAIVGFLGVTRASPGTPAPGQESEAEKHAGRIVEGLEYEALESMALDVMASIADEIEDRYGVEHLAIVHRTGAVPLGEASVAIVACAPHRDAAFEAARYAIDETKARAPIWKAERFSDGKVWIGEPARETPHESNEPAHDGPARE